MADYNSHWFLSDEPLDHYATNVEKRSGSWRVSGRRGENYEVPSRNGAVHNESKPFEQQLVTLDMWALGAMPNGEVPVSESEALKCRNNLDDLSRLFGFKGLRELIRADTPGYGRRNLIPNPSAENAGQLIVARENIINNPSGEYTEGTVITRRNFADNPGVEKAAADQAYRTNWVRNPRMANESEPTITLRNWAKNPSAESGEKFWREQLNCKIATSRKVRVGGSWPVQGQQSMRMVALAAGNAGLEVHSIEVDPTKNWTFSGYVWQRTEASMTCRMFVRWFNKNGAFISATSNVDVVVPIEGTTRLNQTILAASVPAAAATAAVRFVLVSAVEDDVMYVDGVMATPTSALKDYFDGDTDETDGYRYRWRDAAGRSISLQYKVPVKGWYTDPTKAVMSATTEHSKIGVQGARVVIETATATNDTIFRQTVAGGCKLDESEWCVGQISVKRKGTLNDDAAATRTIKGNLVCYDSNGVSLGVVTDSGGSALADATLEIRPGAWQDLKLETPGLTRAETAKVVFRVTCGEAWAVDDVVYFDCAIVENAKKLDEWFDGNLDDDDTFDYIWSGDPHWSESEVRGSRVLGWTAFDGRQFQSTDSYLREFAMQLQPYRSPDSAERPRVVSDALDIRPGRKHRLSAWVKLSRSHSIQLGISYDGGETWTYGGATSPSANTYTRLSFGFTADAAADPELTQISVASNAAPADGDTIQIDAIMFEPCEALRAYFDGDSGRRFSWEDEDDRSISIRTMDRANGWFGYGSGWAIPRRVTVTGSQGTHAVRAIAAQAGDLGVTFAQDGIDADLDYSFGIDIKPGVTRNGYVAIVWLDEEGEQVGIDQSSTTSLSSASWTRKTITAQPDAGASVGVPIAVVVGASADEAADFDGAVFGFGASTDYKDGNSGSGWEWVGQKGISESRQMLPGVDYWRSNNGTLVQNASWSTDRDKNATFTATATSTSCFAYAIDTGDGDERRFELKPDSADPLITFRVDCRAVTVDQQFELRLLLSRWRKQGWSASTAPSNPISAKELVAAGTNETLTLTVDTSTFDIGDATHFRPAIYIYNASGGACASGQVARFDKACVSRDDVSVYIDGGQEWVIWTGDADASQSKRVGPARAIQVERVAGIDIVSEAQAKLAKFTVQFLAPNVFWEDTITKTQKLAIPRAGGVLEFDAFVGMTAPIEDAIITINGPINDPKITDVASGQWIRLDERFRDDQNVVIDNKNFKVARGNGKLLWTKMRYSGDSVLLPVSVGNTRKSPRLKIEADSIGRGAYLTVKASRKYHIG